MEFLYFDFYDYVWWLGKKHPSMADENIILGWWLGISHKIGSDMFYWVLTIFVKFFSQTTVHNVISNYLLDPYMKG